jgi:hypothetical protein
MENLSTEDLVRLVFECQFSGGRDDVGDEAGQQGS